MNEHLRYCIQTVKQANRYKYLSGLLLPPVQRQRHFVINAFDIELSGILNHVKNKESLGQMRFQFWRDLVEQVYAGNTIRKLGKQSIASVAKKSHPIETVLVEFFPENSNQLLIEQILDSRQSFFLNQSRGQPFKNLSELNVYSMSVELPKYHLIIRPEAKAEVKSIFQNASKAIGIIKLFQNFPSDVSKGLCSSFPLDVIQAEGLTFDLLFNDIHKQAKNGNLIRIPKFEKAIENLSETCEEYLQNVHREINGFSRERKIEISPLINDLVPLESYLRRLKKEKFNLFQNSLSQPEFKEELKIGFKLLYQKYIKS